MTTSYRDFVMKMNVVLAAKDVDWSIDLNKITDEEMALYWDLIGHIFVYFSEFLFEESRKRSDLEKSKIDTIRVFIELTNMLVLFLLKKEPERLFRLLWKQVDQEVEVGELVLEESRLTKVKIDGKDFIGSDEQLPIMLKFLVSISSLMFRPGYTIPASDSGPEKIDAISAEYGWTRFAKTSELVSNRVALLEFLMTLVLTERRFSHLNKYNANSVLIYFKSWKLYLGLLRSLLQAGTGYEENGVLPYSGYFFKEFMEISMYLSALSINLAILFLAEETETARLEKTNNAPILPVYFVKNYMMNQGWDNDTSEEPLFDDETFLIEVLDKIVAQILAYFQKSKTLLPNSLKEVR